MRVLMLGMAVLLAAGTAGAQTRATRPTQPEGPVPSGGVVPVKPVGGSVAAPPRSILYVPQFAPPGVQVPGGPPAQNYPTLIPTQSIIGLGR